MKSISEEELRYALGNAFIKFNHHIPELATKEDTATVRKLTMRFINSLLQELNIDKRHKIKEIVEKNNEQKQ